MARWVLINLNLFSLRYRNQASLIINIDFYIFNIEKITNKENEITVKSRLSGLEKSPSRPKKGHFSPDYRERIPENRESLEMIISA